jgi:benzoyl-CoA reductase/2-hydroxyglutaryl-CoA dehydratase subunit BcrC/BadD/HgdB
VEAMTITGASYFMDKMVFIDLANVFYEEVLKRENEGKNKERIIIKGCVLTHTRLHEMLENEGAIVVAEDDWLGSRSVTKSIPLKGDLLENLFEKYYAHTPSPRLYPSVLAHKWFKKKVKKGIDKVVFYLPKDDDVLGWEMPKLISTTLPPNIFYSVYSD